MASRFDRDYTQDYVSQYVPLPLEMIAAAGAEKQKQYDTSLKDVSSDLLGGININASLPVYGQQGGIENIDAGFNNIKNKYTASINAKRDKIAEDLMSGKVEPGGQQMYQLKRETVNAANELKSYENVAKQINTANELISNNEAYATNPYYATELLSYNTKWKQDADLGNIRNYAPPGIAKEFDIQNEVKNMTFKTEGGERVSIDDYIRTTGATGVPESRVREAARDIFMSPMSKVRQNADLYIKNDMQMNPQKYKTQADVEAAYQYHKAIFEDMAVKQHAGTIVKDDIKNNSKADIDYKAKKELELRYREAETKPSDFVTNSINEIKQISKDVIDDKGQLKWDKVQDKPGGVWNTVKRMFTTAPFTSSPVQDEVKYQIESAGTSAERSAALRKGMNEMANFVGYQHNESIKDSKGINTQTLNSNEYQTVLDKYTEFTNLRGAALKYDKYQSTGFTEDLLSVPDNYIYYDKNGQILANDERAAAISDTSKSVFGRDRLRVGNNKEASYVEQVKLSDGTMIYAESKGDQTRAAYNGLANILNSQDKWITNPGQTTSFTMDTENVDKFKKILVTGHTNVNMSDISSVNYDPIDTNNIIVGTTYKDNGSIVEVFYTISQATGEISRTPITARDLISQTDALFQRSKYGIARDYQKEYKKESK